MLACDQLRDERQVGYLGSSPAKLEDDDEWDDVEECRRLWGALITPDTGVEYEGEGGKLN